MNDELIPKDEVKRAAIAAGKVVSQRMSAVPTRLGPLIAPVTDIKEVVAILDKEVRDIMEEFGLAIKKIGNADKK